ncbi:hypothetical protein ACFQ0T_34255 [Kitasatospora gansuensis]
MPILADSPLSLWSKDSVLSIGSVGSVLSIGSVGSVLSVGSVGSVLSLGSIGSALSVVSTASWLSTGSLLSAQSRWSVLSWRSHRGFRTAGVIAVAAASSWPPGPGRPPAEPRECRVRFPPVGALATRQTGTGTNRPFPGRDRDHRLHHPRQPAG